MCARRCIASHSARSLTPDDATFSLIYVLGAQTADQDTSIDRSGPYHQWYASESRPNSRDCRAQSGSPFITCTDYGIRVHRVLQRAALLYLLVHRLYWIRHPDRRDSCENYQGYAIRVVCMSSNASNKMFSSLSARCMSVAIVHNRDRSHPTRYFLICLRITSGDVRHSWHMCIVHRFACHSFDVPEPSNTTHMVNSR